jgi:hypothetical protein
MESQEPNLATTRSPDLRFAREDRSQSTCREEFDCVDSETSGRKRARQRDLARR